jgi:hypothetical protein
MDAFASRVTSRINIDVPFEYGTKLWARKMCDYKPTLAFLYSELIQPKHKYWGFVDNDLIWGDINSYADWFNGPNQYQAVYSVMWTPGGYFSVFENAEWSIRLFIDQKSNFVSLLKNGSHHNLDGTYIIFTFTVIIFTVLSLSEYSICIYTLYIYTYGMVWHAICNVVHILIIYFYLLF